MVEVEMLSARDIVELLDIFLPRRDLTLEQSSGTSNAATGSDARQSNRPGEAKYCPVLNEIHHRFRYVESR